MQQVNADANIVAGEHGVREYLPSADKNLEGTYIVRIFAAFEAALRSYDRYHLNDPERETRAATMIDQLGRKIRRQEDSTTGKFDDRKIRRQENLTTGRFDDRKIAGAGELQGPAGLGYALSGSVEDSPEADHAP